MIETVDQHNLDSERAMLLRFCVRYTGDAETAEDIVQQTLLRAWQHGAQLRDSQARPAWLLGIARNLCHGWARDRRRDRTHRIQALTTGAPSTIETIPDSIDLELDLERDELALLLDRAMALLPEGSRDVLIRRYIEGTSQADVAAYLGLTEGAVEAKVHRGKLTLKRILSTHLREEAVAFGLVSPSQAGWEATPIWCPTCGAVKLQGKFGPGRGELYLYCPTCADPDNHHIGAHMGDGLDDIRMYRPAVSRVLDTIHSMFRTQARDGAMPCPGCGDTIRIRTRQVAQPWGHEQIYLYCARCDWLDCETWQSLCWSLPQVRRFWRDHPRMRFGPPQNLHIDGRDAVLSTVESVTSAARLEIVTLRDTFEVARITGAP